MERRKMDLLFWMEQNQKVDLMHGGKGILRMLFARLWGLKRVVLVDPDWLTARGPRWRLDDCD